MKDSTKEIISWIAVFAVAFILAFVLNKFIIINANIPSGSMEDTINIGDRVFGNRLAYKSKSPKRGDIIIFWSPVKENTYYIKRIIGLPGETVEIKDRTVYINGEALKEDYISEDNWIKKGQEGKWIIPEGQYFMMGDNKDDSTDSRAWGPIEKKDIVAKAFLRYRFWKPLIKGIE